MIYSYLFEAKSIQTYLFASNKMKDVISASERLDNLINNNQHSVLEQVLEAGSLNHDLHDVNMNDDESTIHFVRCKGGAFYCYCSEEAPLRKLRSLWTLTLQQLFPSLVQCDALVQGETVQQALEEGHQCLAESRNQPQVNYPLATAISLRASRTGKQAVTTDRRTANSVDEEVDADVALHREYYRLANVASSSPLQQRFGQTDLGITFDDSFDDFIKRDLALIHIDGNGLGKLLIGLKTALADANAYEYRKAFRQFSDALEQATVTAATIATKAFYEQYQQDSSADIKTLPMRPIVLGGDDLTVFIKAEYALDFAKTFCKEFEKESKQSLSNLVSQYKGLPNQLSASGAIVYHKVNHPFVTMSELTEQMCGLAKSLTKGVTQEQVGPAALSLLRLGTVSQKDASALLKQTLTFNVDGIQGPLSLGHSRYFVEEVEGHNQHFALIERLLENSLNKRAPVSMARWRQMATHLSANDLPEAKRIFERGVELCPDVTLENQLFELLEALCPQGYQRSQWWYQGPKDAVTIINDLLLLEHYRKDKDKEKANDQA